MSGRFLPRTLKKCLSSCAVMTGKVPHGLRLAGSSLHTSAGRWNDGNLPPNAGKQIPRLMAEPLEILFPNLPKTLSNYIKSRFVVKSHFDPDFDMAEFVRGARQAVALVSSLLAKGDFESLKGLIEPAALTEIERNLSHFSMNQRQSLQVSLDDMYLHFPYELGIMFDEKTDVQERFVEILMCYHFCKNLSDLPDFIPGPSAIRKYHDRILICNLRFHRNFTKGVQSPWIINFANFFRLPVSM